VLVAVNGNRCSEDRNDNTLRDRVRACPASLTARPEMVRSSINATCSSLPGMGKDFIHSRPQPSVRLFCFPYAGGGATVFRKWQDDMPGTIQVCPIQLPGRERRFRGAQLKDAEFLRALRLWVN